jgi:hypothetical protein
MMHSAQLLDAIQARNTYVLFTNAFRQHGLDVVGRGWLNTRNKLEELLADPVKGPNVLSELNRIYIDNILYANKGVVLWSIARDDAQLLVARLEEFIVESPYATKYPFPLTTEELRSGAPLGVPTAVHGDDKRKTLVYASWRSRMEEDAVPESDIPVNYRSAGYTEMVVKKKSVFQVYDSVTVYPQRELVELRIDAAKTLSEKEIYAYRNALASRFNETARALILKDQVLRDAVNMVPALVPLYNGREWIVSQIEHVNEGGYNNSNRGRRRTDDVRRDTYHTSGEAAVTNLQLWNVNAVFKSSERISAPQLVLEGHSSMLSALNPYMDLARINDCSSKEDYEYVFDALLKCLSIGNDGAVHNSA